MGWGEYARSKIPLKLVFILMAAVAANLMLIEGFKLLLFFVRLLVDTGFDPSGNVIQRGLTGYVSYCGICTVIQ